MPYGRRVIGNVGSDIQVLASGQPIWMRSGVTFDWTNVPAVSGSPFALPEGIVVPVGQKYLRYGQVITKVTNPTVLTLTITGTPTGGTFAYTGVRPDNGATLAQTIAFNASVATVQAAMDAIYGAGNTLVAGAGPLPGNALTITGQGGLAFETIQPGTLALAGLSGGTPGGSVVATNAGANTGWFGPYDPAATDGRQNLARGNVGIVNRTILQSGVLGTFTIRNVDNFGVLTGGSMFKGRVLQAGAGAASLAAGPQLAALEAAMPLVIWTTN